MSTLSKEQIENRIRELVEQEEKALEQIELDHITPVDADNQIDLKSLFIELEAIRSEFRQMNRTEKSRLDTLKTYFDEETHFNRQLRDNINTLVANNEHTKTDSILLSLAEIMDFIRPFQQALPLMLNNSQHGFRTWLRKFFLQKDIDYITQNVDMIVKKLERLMEKSGMFPVDSDGEIFDPSTMTAIEKTSDPRQPDQKVLETLEKGYLLQNKVLRFAKVKVNVTKIPPFESHSGKEDNELA